MDPRISVVIPARNAGPFLRDALDSVFSQGIEDPEVVVVDDGSTDATAEVARSYGRRVRLLSQPPSGSARARNAGLRATRGEIVAFLDADDLWEPDKTGLQLELLGSRPELGLVFSDMIAFDETGVHGETYFRQRGFDGTCRLSSIFLYDMISTPTVLVRRACLDEAGPFDESLRIGQDTDLWFRIAKLFAFEVVNRPLVRRRFHGGNVTRDSRLLADSVVRIWRAHLDDCIAREPEMEARLRRDFARKLWHREFLEGCEHLGQGRPREARERFGRAIAAAPGRPRAYLFYLAALMRRQGHGAERSTSRRDSR